MSEPNESPLIPALPPELNRALRRFLTASREDAEPERRELIDELLAGRRSIREVAENPAWQAGVSVAEMKDQVARMQQEAEAAGTPPPTPADLIETLDTQAEAMEPVDLLAEREARRIPPRDY